MNKAMLDVFASNEDVVRLLVSCTTRSEVSPVILPVLCDIVVHTPPKHPLSHVLLQSVVSELQSYQRRLQGQYDHTKDLHVACLTLAILRAVDTTNEVYST